MSPIAPFVLLAAFVPHSADTTPPGFLGRPVITVGPNASTPLAVRLVVATNEAARIQIHVNDGTRSWSFFPSSAYASQQTLALAGFRAGRTHTVRLVAFDAAGNRRVLQPSLVFATPALPASFPLLHVTTVNTAAMEPGVTLSAFHATSATQPFLGSYLVYLDERGEVVWLHHTLDTTGYGAIRLRNGHILFIANLRLAREIDLLGNTVTEWWAARLGLAGMPPGATPVDCDAFHHELDELPLGDAADFVALSHELRDFPDYPASEFDPTITVPTAHVIGDEVVEFRRDGSVVRRKSLFDVLDPYRMCYDSLAQIGTELYGVLGADWSHANTVTIDPTDGDWIVSLRNQDAVVKMARGSGAIRWILGPPDRWVAPWSQHVLTPSGANFSWFYHQHAPRVDTAGRIVLYDNGNYVATPPTPPPSPFTWTSRAVSYRVDALAGTVEQSWEYDGGAEPFFSRFYCEADPLPATGNVLVTDGWRRVSPTVNRTYGRIVEVTGATPPAKVFEVIVNDPAVAANPYNWTIYRSQRLARILP